MVRVFFQKHSLSFMGNVGIYSVGAESMYQRGQFGKTECFANVSREGLTHATCKTQLSPSVLTLQILVMCRAHASFRRMLSHEILAKTLQSSICLSLHTLSLTQPLQLNPTINKRYNRLNKITIKFGTKLKPTKYIVVNYNFTIFPFGYFVTNP